MFINWIEKIIRKSINIGAIVLATGCQNFFPVEKYGIEPSSQVITLSELEKLLNRKEDLKSINTQYRKELIEACTKVIDNGWYVQGVECKEFEKEFEG